MNDQSLDAGMHEKMQIMPIKERFNLLFVGIIIHFIYSAFAVFQQFQYTDLIKRFNNGDVGAAYEIVQKSQQTNAVSILLGLLTIAGVVFICMWIYRASFNVHAAGMQGLNYTPGWNVGWFFIPVIHIIMPVNTMRETVKASHSINNIPEYGGWQSNATPVTFKIWALAYILRIAFTYAMVVYSFTMIQEIAQGNVEASLKIIDFGIKASYITLPLNLLEAVCLVLLARKVTQEQTTYLEQA